MPIDLNDPIMAGYTPLQYYIDQGGDTSNWRIKDIPYGKKREDVTFSTVTMNFGEVEKDNTSPSQVLTLTNAGYDEVNIFGFTLDGEFVLRSSIPAKLLPAETVSIQIACEPTIIGAVIGSLYINTGDAAGDEYVTLTATGVLAVGITPTITGSRGANAALTSLLTELATLGVIINNTTV